jgi:hypothetical protein
VNYLLACSSTLPARRSTRIVGEEGIKKQERSREEDENDDDNTATVQGKCKEKQHVRGGRRDEKGYIRLDGIPRMQKST